MLPIDHVESSYIVEALHGLTATDVVMVIGAYKGDTCNFIRYYHPKVRLVAFEPQEWAYKVIADNAREKMILPYNVALGLADDDNTPLFEYGTDAASFLNMPGARTLGKCRCVDAVSFLREHHLTKVAFAVINIEGYEYALIPYVLAHDDLEFGTILVQCHHKEMYRTAWVKMQESLNAHNYTMQDVGKGWELWQRLA